MTWSIPSVLVLVGAILVAVGTFLSASKQSGLNAELKAKNEDIIKIQAKSLDYMKGTQRIRLDVTTNMKPVDGLLDLTLFKEDDSPAYDVVARIQRNVDKINFDRISENDIYDLGTINSHLSTTKIRLPYGYYQINISTRAGNITEMLHIAPAVGDKTGLETYIMYDVQSWDGHFVDRFSGFPKSPP